VASFAPALRRVAASIALVGLAAALWNALRPDDGSPSSSPTSPFSPTSPTSPPVAIDDRPNQGERSSEAVALNAPRLERDALQPQLVSDAAPAPATAVEPGGLHKVGLHKVGEGEMPLWRGARRFGASTGGVRSNDGWQNAWQAASYPAYDPRVR
jgi:hypothetical protein